MRKTIIFSLALITLFQFSTWAQPVATISNVSLNFSGEFYFSEATGFSPGNAGPNQTWDYSALDLMFIGTDTSVPVAASPYASTFPTANYCYKFSGIFGGGDRYYYHHLTEDSYDLLSLGYNNTSGDNYNSNPRTFAVFPYTYNTVFTDSYESTAEPGVVTVTATYDAYGTLIMPFATYTNVIRQKVVSGGNTNYHWFNVEPFYPILQTVLEENSLGIVKNTSVLNVDEQKKGQSTFTAYPNPTRDAVTLECLGDISGELQITVYDILGNNIISKNEFAGNNQITLNLQKYSAGIYFLRVSDKSNQAFYIQKIIKQ